MCFFSVFIKKKTCFVVLTALVTKRVSFIHRVILQVSEASICVPYNLNQFDTDYLVSTGPTVEGLSPTGLPCFSPSNAIASSGSAGSPHLHPMCVWIDGSYNFLLKSCDFSIVVYKTQKVILLTFTRFL